jgi:hypothetical protein
MLEKSAKFWLIVAEFSREKRRERKEEKKRKWVFIGNL